MSQFSSQTSPQSGTSDCNIQSAAPLPLWHVLLLFALLYAVLPALFNRLLIWSMPDLASGNRLVITHILAYGLWLMILGVWARQFRCSLLQLMGLTVEKPFWLYVYDGLCCGGVILTLGFVLGQLALYFNWPHWQPFELFSRETLRVIALLAVLLSPIIEEITFRGILQPTLARYFSPGKALVFTAFLFTVMHHLYYAQWLALVYVFCMALVLGVFRQISGSTWPSVIGHFVNNLIAAIVLLYTPS